MPSASYGVSLQVGSVSIQRVLTRSGNHPNSYEVNLPVGKLATAWVKTDANTAACNLSSGHGIVTGKVDVYFAAGVRYGVDATVSTNALALDGGAGTDFPASASADCVVAQQVSVNTAIDGDNIVIIGVIGETTDQSIVTKVHVDFLDSGAATIRQMNMTANAMDVIDVYGGAANPYTGNPITVCKASNANTSSAVTLKICSLENA